MVTRHTAGIAKGGLMLRTVCMIALLLGAAVAAQAQSPPQPPAANPLGLGTEKERKACAPDVVKYCGEFIKDNAPPDVFEIQGCLLSNRPKISAACRDVLDNHPQ
jgi:hypothetical protein